MMQFDAGLFCVFHNAQIHEAHKCCESKQIGGEERYGDVVCNKTEEGRQQADADIGTCHLHTDDRLRTFRAKVLRG